MKIINLHDKNEPQYEPRAGDIYSAPILYFKFPCPTESVNVRDIDTVDLVDEETIFILGGGGMLHIPFPEYDEGRFLLIEKLHDFKDRVILWGIGHNVHGLEKIEYPSYIKDFRSVGVRDVDQGLNWVPCASCMNEAFAKKYDVKDKIRAYRRDDPHDWWPFHFEQYPILGDAKGHTIEEITEFIGGCETLITNTYHGAYWGMLLGKQIRIHQPFSSKFFGLTKDYDYDGDEMTIQPIPGYYEKCVDKNNQFGKEVMEGIDNGK